MSLARDRHCRAVQPGIAVEVFGTPTEVNEERPEDRGTNQGVEQDIQVLGQLDAEAVNQVLKHKFIAAVLDSMILPNQRVLGNFCPGQMSTVVVEGLKD